MNNKTGILGHKYNYKYSTHTAINLQTMQLSYKCTTIMAFSQLYIMLASYEKLKLLSDVYGQTNIHNHRK